MNRKTSDAKHKFVLRSIDNGKSNSLNVSYFYFMFVIVVLVLFVIEKSFIKLLIEG